MISVSRSLFSHFSIDAKMIFVHCYVSANIHIKYRVRCICMWSCCCFGLSMNWAIENDFNQPLLSHIHTCQFPYLSLLHCSSTTTFAPFYNGMKVLILYVYLNELIYWMVLFFLIPLKQVVSLFGRLFSTWQYILFILIINRIVIFIPVPHAYEIWMDEICQAHQLQQQNRRSCRIREERIADTTSNNFKLYYCVYVQFSCSCSREFLFLISFGFGCQILSSLVWFLCIFRRWLQTEHSIGRLHCLHIIYLQFKWNLKFRTFSWFILLNDVVAVATVVLFCRSIFVFRNKRIQS